MTFLPLARTLLAAAAPILSSPDSTPLARTNPLPTPGPIAAPAPAAASTPAVPAMDSTLANPMAALVAAIAAESPLAANTLAMSAAAPTASAATSTTTATTAAKAAVKIGGLVPMPAWAIGAHTGLARAGRADSIVVEKGEHRMTLFAGNEVLGTYLVAIGQQSVGAKERKGDLRTPEGLYYIDGKNPNSQFHLALHVSYPNAADVARARSMGVETGGDIMIHGLPPRFHYVGAQHRAYDWTNGCVAVSDPEIEEIFNVVPVGTPIRIVP
jgi:L,D-peptidoglycan transpeptidase YkuD (ErfK/YbiS/YcfS/YnhG family)